jgi:hypothetical protein
MDKILKTESDLPMRRKYRNSTLKSSPRREGGNFKDYMLKLEKGKKLVFSNVNSPK